MWVNRAIWQEAAKWAGLLPGLKGWRNIKARFRKQNLASEEGDEKLVQ